MATNFRINNLIAKGGSFIDDITINGVSFGKGPAGIVSNIAIGESSLYYNIGAQNVAIGKDNLQYDINGYYNTAIGNECLSQVQNGSYNIAIGVGVGFECYPSLEILESVNSSILIGNLASCYNATGDTNCIAIGDGVHSMGSNSVVLGNDNTTNTYLKGDVQITRTEPLPSDYERIAMRWNGLTGTIGTSKAGVGIARPLALETNGAARMIITTGGNIGINNSTPTERLDVNGNAKISGSLSTNTLGVSGTSVFNSSAAFTVRPTVNGSGVLLIGDSATGSFLTTGTADARYVELTDSPVYQTGNQTISGTKTFAKDIVVNSVSFGRGSGNISTNLAIGDVSLASNVSGTYNTAIGTASLFSNIYGNSNLGIGPNALINLNDGSSNIAIGNGAGVLGYNYDDGGAYPLESINNSLLIGNYITAYDPVGDSNSIVIGNNAGGMGNNSVVLGNDSIANTYLKGDVQIQRSSNGSVSNYERIAMRWNGFTGTIGTSKNGVAIARPLALETDGTARMIITTGGNIGINNNIPTEKLDVNGNAKISGSLSTKTLSNLALFSTSGFAYTGIAPATTGDAGVSGQIAFSSNFLYRHNGTNWQRTGIGFANW